MIITILGAGAMGSALSVPYSDKNEVRIWGTEYDDALVDKLRNGEAHPALGMGLPASVKYFNSSELDSALDGADIVVLAVASVGVVSITDLLKNKVKNLVIVTKGIIEGKSVARYVSDKLNIQPVAVGGPSIAHEVAERKPTRVVYASENSKLLELCEGLGTNEYSTETSDDVEGMEICAATKNVYAILIGICEGAKLGGNLKSALVARSIQEMSSLCEEVGGKRETAFGLAGIGDLQVTISGGRNGEYGRLIGSGLSAEEALEKMKSEGKTVEGYFAVKTIHNMFGNKFPLLNTVYSILYENGDVNSIKSL